MLHKPENKKGLQSEFKALIAISPTFRENNNSKILTKRTLEGVTHSKNKTTIYLSRGSLSYASQHFH